MAGRDQLRSIAKEFCHADFADDADLRMSKSVRWRPTKKHGLNSMLFFAFIFNLVKTFTIHTDNGTLTDKGMWIYLADKTEDSWSLTLLRQHEQHLHILTGIKPLALTTVTPLSASTLMRLPISSYFFEMIKNCTLLRRLFTTWSMQNA